MDNRTSAILLSLWRHFPPALMGLIGAFMLVQWAIYPKPGIADLTEVHGRLVSFSIEADQSSAARYLGRRSSDTVLFKLAGNEGRFWCDAVGPGNVRSVFPRTGVEVTTYRNPHSHFSKIGGDGEKTFGLRVDGTEVQSAAAALRHDAILSRIVVPLLGLIALLTSGWLWREVSRKFS